MILAKEVMSLLVGCKKASQLPLPWQSGRTLRTESVKAESIRNTVPIIDSFGEKVKEQSCFWIVQSCCESMMRVKTFLRR